MRIPGPGDVLRLADQGYRALESAIGLVPRVVAMVDQVQELLDRADGLLGRAGKAVDSAEQLLDEASGLLQPFRPALQRLEAIAERLAETTSPAEVDAVVQVVNLLPGVVVALREDILPILNTLDTVAPDIRDLLLASRELNEILGAIPGLGRAKRRAEHEIESAIPPVPPAESGSSSAVPGSGTAVPVPDPRPTTT